MGADIIRGIWFVLGVLFIGHYVKNWYYAIKGDD